MVSCPRSCVLSSYFLLARNHLTRREQIYCLGKYIALAKGFCRLARCREEKAALGGKQMTIGWRRRGTRGRMESLEGLDYVSGDFISIFYSLGTHHSTILHAIIVL